MSRARVLLYLLVLIPAGIGLVVGTMLAGPRAGLEDGFTAAWVFLPSVIAVFLLTQREGARPRVTLRWARIVACCLGQWLLWILSATPWVLDREAAERAVVRQDMMDLASQEQIYHMDSLSYTTDLRAVGFFASREVQLEIEAGLEGWSVRGKHEAQDDFSCVLYVGRIANPFATHGGLVPSREGEIRCEPPFPNPMRRDWPAVYHRELQRRSILR